MNAAEVLALMDKHLPDPTLARCGLSADEVRAACRRAVAPRGAAPLAADRVRVAAARAWPKQAHGGRKIPSHVIAVLAADYARLGSTRAVGQLWGRDACTVLRILHSHGIAVKRRGGPNHRLPDNVVADIAADYAALGSLRATGERHGLCGSAVRYLLKSRGVPLRAPGGGRAKRWSIAHA